MNNENAVKRYHGIDVLKFLCAFLVVCIHAPFPGVAGEYIVALSRVAVPVFFMITGFFYKDTADNNKEIKQIIKLMKLIVFSTCLYFLFNISIGILKYIIENDFSLVFDAVKIIDKNTLVNFIVFNDSPVASHLWYLNAIVYVLICVYFLRKCNLFKVLYWLTPLLLCADLIFGKYSVVFWGRSFNILYVRNFLCVGIPYFTIGYIIRNLYEHGVFKKKQFNKRRLLIYLILCSVMCIMERYILIFFDVNATRDHYLFTTLLACALFIWSLSPFEVNNDKFKWISDIGKNDSLNIYIFHPIIIFVMEMISRILHVGKIYAVFAPVIVFSIAVIVSKLYRYIMRKLKRSDIN